MRLGEGLTLLIVDDDRDLLPSLVAMIETFTSFKVVTASNGDDGLIYYYDVHPACMIIDVKMPGLNGYQLVRALRGDPSTAQTPLIILSAMIQDHDRYIGLIAGVDRYLLKPVKPSDLLSTIAESLEMSKVERDKRIRELANSEKPSPLSQG
jgi:DNA-binding response OmpR family regulator